MDLDCWVDRCNRTNREVDFVGSRDRIVVPSKYVPIEIGLSEGLVLDQRQLPNPKERELLDHVLAEATAPDDSHVRLPEFFLPVCAEEADIPIKSVHAGA
jgi:hypothetical protein